MTYPGGIYRVVFGGSLYSDIWSTGFNVISKNETGGFNPPALTGAQVNTLSAIVSSWYSGGGGANGQFNADAVLKFFKINELDADGHYVSSVTNEVIYPTPVAGQGAGGMPAQLSVVATLRTAVERGLAAKGRMYMPCATGFNILTAGDGRATVANALRVADSIRQLIHDFNIGLAALPSHGASPMCVGVASKTRSGGQHVVTDVTVGRAVDTMRSRRNKIVEAPVSSTPGLSLP